MNNNYPYPIDDARYIPSSEDDAQERYSELLDCTDLQALDTPAFLRGWFAIHFLGVAPHPDEPGEWDEMIRHLVDEAWRRRETDEITGHQLYCSCAQLQGLRLALDGNLRCHVQGRVGDQTGYVSAEFDSERGNVPILTGIGAKAYIYESPQKAAYACRRLDLDTIEIYSGSPDRDMDCPPVIEIPMKELPDMEVVIQTEEGLYLYRDGKTLGDSHVLACKYMLYADNVEQQIQQVKTMLDVTWTWVDYSTLH
jgi:hypothetical protein